MVASSTEPAAREVGLAGRPVPAAPTENPAADARALMRLGWMVAETRGRYRLGDDRRLSPLTVDRAGAVLPLATERTPAELRIEAEKVLTQVAGEQKLDFQARADLGIDRSLLPSDDVTASAYMRLLGATLAAVRKDRDRAREDTVLRQLGQLFYTWDSTIQDKLAAEAYGRSSAYQLGRGLAETYWSLDPAAERGSYYSWHHLLVQRFNPLAALLRRSAALLPSLTAETLTATLEQWRGVAVQFSPLGKRGRAAPPLQGTDQERQDASAVLGVQAALWRDLLLSGNPPTALVATDKIWFRARNAGPLLRSFAGELLGLLLGLLLVAVAIVLVTGSAPGVPRTLIGTLAGVFGAFGLTSSAVVARAKAVGQGLLQQLRDKIAADAVIAAATYLPVSYSKRAKSVRQSASAGSDRHLGPTMKYGV